MILIVFVLGLLNFIWGEKVQAGGGLGWDGVLYADMVRNLDSLISGGQLNSYYAHRILPSLIVRSMMLFSGTPTSDINIIRGFELYNLVLLVGACWVWKRVADSFSLSLSGRWIGFSGIFVNFQCSKQAFYYPVLTDVTALVVAMLLLLFYVEKKPIALFVTTIVGAFCWPAVSICGAFLLIFPREDLPREVIEPAASTLTFKSVTLSSLVKLGGLVVLIMSIIGYITLARVAPVSEHASTVFNNWLKILGNVMPFNVAPSFDRLERLLTGLPSLIGMLVALAMLIGSRSFLPALLANLRRAQLPLVALAIAAVLIPFYLVKIISSPGIANPNSMLQLIKRVLVPGDDLHHLQGKFLLPIVTLAVFWGPVVLLLLLYWKAFCVEARKLGLGVVAIIAISLPLGLIGEPRFITIAWPFFVLGLVLALESSSTKASFKYVLAALTVVYAQFWMKLNLAPWLPQDMAYPLKFPQQVYFMHYGLWMSWWAYFVQLTAVVLSAIWLHKTVIKVGIAKDKC
ncbi:MAG: hypothetical protein ACLQF0_15635 [Dissulfurispiraceae bacterium]